MQRREFLLGSVAAATSASVAMGNTRPAAKAKQRKPKTEVELAALPEEGLFLVRPHLQFLSETSASVVWMTKRPATGFVEWSQDGGASWRTAWDETDGLRDAGSRVHISTLRGFDPAKSVTYRACSQETPKVGAYKTEFKGEVEKVESTLGAIVPKDGKISFAMFNDVHCNHKVYSTLLDKVRKPVNFTVFVGDIINSTDSEQVLVRDLLAPLSYVGGRTGAAMWYLRGNHETRGGYARYMRDHLALPNGLFYGAVTLGAARIVFIDTGEDKEDDHREYSGIVDFDHYIDRQIEWLKEEFASDEWRNAKFRIAVMHIPPPGVKTLEGGTWNGATKRMKRLTKVLNDSKVSLVMAAHLHRSCNADATATRPYPVVVGGGSSVEFDAEKKGRHNDATLTRCSYDCKELIVEQYAPDGSLLFKRVIPA